MALDVLRVVSPVPPAPPVELQPAAANKAKRDTPAVRPNDAIIRFLVSISGEGTRAAEIRFAKIAKHVSVLCHFRQHDDESPI